MISLAFHVSHKKVTVIGDCDTLMISVYKNLCLKLFIAPEKMAFQKDRIVFQPSFLRRLCYTSGV